MSGLATTVKGVRSEMNAGSQSAGRLNTSMLAMGARLAMFQTLRDAVKDLGEAFTDARRKAGEFADKNVALRDQYRELANLQEKPEPDDQVVGAL